MQAFVIDGALTSVMGGDAPIVRTIWTAAYLFIGPHIEPAEEALFTSGEFYVRELATWLGLPRISHTGDLTPDGSEVRVATHKRPPPIHIPVPASDLDVAIFTDLTRSAQGENSLHWEQRVAVAASPTGPQPFGWFMDRLGDVRALFGLLVGDPVTPVRVALWRMVDEDLDPEERRWAEITSSHTLVYFGVRGADVSARLPIPLQMIASYEDVRERLSEIVESWFAKRDQLETTVALLFGTLYSRELPQIFRFLALTQGLETLHRRTRPGEYVDRTTYAAVEKALATAIPQTVPRDLRQALTKRIGYGNEFAQRRRFKDLRHDLGDETRALILPEPRFLEDVVDARNFLTHYPAGETAPMAEAELFATSMRLRAFICALLLLELGFTDAEIARGIGRTPWFVWYVRNQWPRPLQQ
jgi:hypothetical protein